MFLFGFLFAGNVRGRFRLGCLWFLNNDDTRAMCGQGGMAGAHCWQKHCRECVHEIIIVHNLLCQSKAKCWFPVWLLVPQLATDSATFSVISTEMKKYFFLYTSNVKYRGFGGGGFFHARTMLTVSSVKPLLSVVISLGIKTSPVSCSQKNMKASCNFPCLKIQECAMMLLGVLIPAGSP